MCQKQQAHLICTHHGVSKFTIFITDVDRVYWHNQYRRCLFKSKYRKVYTGISVAA